MEYQITGWYSSKVKGLEVENAALRAELAKCAEALPGSHYMDPPDGGDVPISEQLRRMAAELATLKAGDVVMVPRDVVRFLNGRGALDGVWFGGSHPDYTGAFWWRKYLPEAPGVQAGEKGNA